MAVRSTTPMLLFSLMPFALASISSAADTATFENYSPASSVTKQTFSCVGSRGTDAVIEFATLVKKPGQRESRLNSLTISGKELSAKLLAEINTTVGPSNITGAMAGCSSDGIRVVINMFMARRLEEGATREEAQGYIHVYLHKGAEEISLE